MYYENTYQLDPPAKFRADQVKPIIEQVLEANLQGRENPIPLAIDFQQYPLNINMLESITDVMQ